MYDLRDGKDLAAQEQDELEAVAEFEQHEGNN